MQAGSTLFVSCPFLRSVLAVWLGAAFAIFAFAGAMGVGASRWLATLISVAIAAGVGWLSWKHPVVAFDEKATSRTLSIVFVLAATLSVAQLVRVCVFIVNPAAVSFALGRYEVQPGNLFRHSCLSAYYVAAKSIATEQNIYDEFKLYSFPQTNLNVPRKPRIIGPFDIDPYEYPPTFLLLPRTLAIVAPQFLNFRMLWFALNGLAVLIGLLAVVQMYDPDVGTRVLLLSPLVLAANVTISTLQIGNLQAAVYALAMLAMVLFTQRHYAAGGALLAFIIVSKLFPGLLIVYLAVRREWRAVVWTTGLCTALVGISLLDTGRVPYVAFLHHLPRLLSGESFAAFRAPGGTAINLSVPGFLFKLKLFGLPNGSFALMKTVGTIYTLIAVAATVAIALRKPGHNQQPFLWLAVLILGSLRSPFLPNYGLFPVLWLLTLLVAMAAPAVRTLCLMLVAWVVLNIALPTSNGPDPRLVAAFTLVLQAIIVVLLVLTLRSRQETIVAVQPAAALS